jgi:hypothetical protein
VWTGSAWLYEHKTGTNDWLPAGTVGGVAATARSKLFGLSVAIHPDCIAVGAPDDGDGSVEIFQRSALTSLKWQSTQVLRVASASGKSLYGSSVAMGLGQLVVGAPRFTFAGNTAATGAAVLYRFDKTKPQRWLPTLCQPNTNPGEDSAFGRAVACDSGLVVIAEPEYAGLRGLISVVEDGSSNGSVGDWQLSRLGAPNLEKEDEIGKSVAVSEGIVAIGTDDREVGPGTDGEVFLYTRGQATGYGPAGPWRLATSLKGHLPWGKEDFGHSLAVWEGHTLGVGAPTSATASANGAKVVAGTVGCGALYLYEIER